MVSELIAEVWDELFANWRQSIERWSQDQQEFFLQLLRAAPFDLTVVLGALAAYILGSAERLAKLIVQLFGDIPQAFMEVLLNRILERFSTVAATQVVVRQTAIRDCLVGIGAGGVRVGNLQFELGGHVTSLVLRFKKLLTILSGPKTIRNIVLSFVGNVPIKILLAVVDVLAVLWKGIAIASAMGIMYVVATSIERGEIMIPLSQSKSRRRITMSRLARVPVG